MTLFKFAIAVAVLASMVATSHARHSVKSNTKPWPRSECRNGWVDRMTGMCPYRRCRK